MNEAELRRFTGTEQYYKGLCGIKYTDGIQYLAEKGNCYWLLDLIASYQEELYDHAFQIWTIKKVGNGGIVTCKEDTNDPVLVQQEIAHMEFPFEEYEVYCIGGIVLLKSEY